MWIDEGRCRLCLVSSRTSDLIKLNEVNVLPQALRIIAKMLEEEKNTRDEIFVETFNGIKRLINNEDPYESLKRDLNKLGQELSIELRKVLEENQWNLELAMKFSASANIIDTSVLGYEPKELREAIWDQPVKFGEVALPSKDTTIYFILDNSGEAYVDLLFIEALKKSKYDVKTVIREKSYEIDVTPKEFKADIITPSNYSPVKYIRDGFIIAKGIANLEAYISLENSPPALLLFRTKCDVLSMKFRVRKNTPIIAEGYYAKKLLSTKSFNKPS
ncbi:MAG: DUF89 family protein [Sulfolobus sp.]|nr:DUF89 family protein [Sulfolobus sp.]